MAKLKKEWIESGAVGTDAFKAENNSYLKARNNADNADIDVIKVNASDEIEFASIPKVGANNLLDASQKGVASGVASLDGSGLVPSSQLPSYIDDVEEYADEASFPVTGETGKIYVALDVNNTFRWSGSAYVEISAGPADTDALAEGSINLYFTDARAKSAAVINSTAGNETDQAASVDSMKSYVASQVTSQTFSTEVLTLNATDISNGYKDLANSPISGSLHVTPVGGLPQVLGVDFNITLGNRLNFTGDLSSELVDGSQLQIHYAY